MILDQNKNVPAVASVSLAPPTFRDTQRPHQWWVWVLLSTVTTLLAWTCFLHQIVAGKPLGSDPAPDWVVLLFWVLCGVVFPLLFVTSHLTVEVRDDHLDVTYFPFFRRQLAYRDMASCKPVTYQPLVHYGGWGIRVNMDGSWAWSMSGNEGVQFVFHNGKRLLIGSRAAQEFARAVEARRRSDC
jgi:hypothetical protein